MQPLPPSTPTNSSGPSRAYSPPKPARIPASTPLLRFLLVFLFSSAIASPLTRLLQAELPVARLATVFPPGGQAGTKLEVSVSGQDLDGARQLRFSHPGITSTPADASPDPTRFSISISDSVPNGIYEARVIGRFGISNPRNFAVGNVVETSEKQPNHSQDAATPIQLPTTINGAADANAIDWFRFEAEEGRRIFIEIAPQLVDSKMEPTFMVTDSHGQELARTRQGKFLDFTPPQTATYFLKVHDFLYRGGSDYFYRATLTTGPWVDFIFPPAVQLGSVNKLTLYGRNLPGGAPAPGMKTGRQTLEKLDVTLDLSDAKKVEQSLSSSVLIHPSASPLDAFDYRLPTQNGVSNPALLTVSPHPIITELEPNNTESQAQTVQLPCEFAGQFFPANDRDWLQVDLKKGETYWIEIASHRLGLPTHPFVLIQQISKNEKGEETVKDIKELYEISPNLAGPEYNTSSKDPAWRFEVKEDASYRILVRDLFNRTQSNPHHVYRLSLRKEAPDFRLVAIPHAPPPANPDAREIAPWSLFLRRGEIRPIKVVAFRRDNFSGPIRLSVRGLPKGMLAHPAQIDAGKNSALLMIEASEPAASGEALISVLGTASHQGADIIREARNGTVVWSVGDFNNEPVPSRLTPLLPIAASNQETVPVQIAPREQTTLETSVAGKLPVPLQLSLNGEIAGPIKLKVVGGSPLDATKEIDVDGKTNLIHLNLDLSQQKLPPGTHSFHVQARAKSKYRNNPDRAKAAEEAAKEAERLAAEAASAAKNASEALATAVTVASAAQTLADSAQQALQSATAAAAASPADAKAAEALAKAKMDAADAASKLQTAQAAKTTAEKTSQDLAAKSKQSEETKTALAKLAKEASDKAQPKELTTTAYSKPITLKVLPAPIQLKVSSPASPVFQGTRLEIPILIERLFGFNENVDLQLLPPKDIQGLAAAKITIQKDQTRGILALEIAPAAPLGAHTLTLEASLKLNGQDLKISESLPLSITPDKASKT